MSLVPFSLDLLWKEKGVGGKVLQRKVICVTQVLGFPPLPDPS
jgi:hypothetical protein